MAINAPVNQAQTVSYAAAVFAQVTPLPARTETLWLVVYASSASDGLVWVSTQDGIDGAANTVANVPDRRPMTPPCQLCMAGRRALAVGVSGAASVTLELVETPVQPTREMPASTSPSERRPSCSVP